MFNRVSYIFLAVLITTIASATILACGNRGPLYLQDSDVERTKLGYELTQDADGTIQKEKAAAKKDKRE